MCKEASCRPVHRNDTANVAKPIEPCNMYANYAYIIHVKDLPMVLLCFAGCLRFNEHSDLRCCGVNSYLISYSKVDVYRKEQHTYMENSTTAACQSGLLTESTDFFFFLDQQ